jgi:hypothetical protein
VACRLLAPGQASGAGQTIALGKFTGPGPTTQGQCQSQGGASLQSSQMSVWFHQGSLQRAGQEHRPSDNTVCPEQLVEGQKADYAVAMG